MYTFGGDIIDLTADHSQRPRGIRDFMDDFDNRGGINRTLVLSNRGEGQCMECVSGQDSHRLTELPVGGQPTTS